MCLFVSEIRLMLRTVLHLDIPGVSVAIRIQVSDFPGQGLNKMILTRYTIDQVQLWMSPVPPVFNTVVTVSIGLKNMLRVGNIHSIILDVYVEWQSAQNFPFLLFLRKLDKNITLSPLFPENLSGTITFV